MKRSDDYHDWPAWAKAAQENMERCGLDGDQLIARALLTGMQVEHADSIRRNAWSKYATIHVLLPPNQGGLLAMSMEMAAYRWLERYHKKLLNTP